MSLQGTGSGHISVTSPVSTTDSEASSKRAGFQMDLLPIEEIYRTAGIVSPQMGYSVHKVIDMLRSKHMRGLDRELKRSAILMALDAAGVSLGQLEADARSRQEALNRYEAEQRKHVEVEWARRAQETAQIQAELERVKSYHMTRISRNLEGIAREKSAFNAWLEGKKREIEETGEVLGLLMSSPSEKASGPPLAKAAAASAGRGGAKAVRRA